MDISKIEYVYRGIKSFSMAPVFKTVGNSKIERIAGHTMTIDGEVIDVSSRTKASLFANIGVAPNIETLFSMDEVFDRAMEKKIIPDNVTLCVERLDNGKLVGHAISFKREFIKVAEVKAAMMKADPTAELTFAGGIVRSVHEARDSEATFMVGGIKFSGGFVVSAPVDGYGDPVTYLSIVLPGLSTGTVLEAPAFKSKIPMGSIGVNAISNTISGYRNPEGYDAIRSQLELANDSWTSIAEALGLYNIMMKSNWEDLEEAKDYMDRFNRTLGRWRGHLSSVIRHSTGGLEEDRIVASGVASLNFIPDKDKRSLPVDASVLDIIKFACNVRTNCRIGEMSKRAIDAYIGQLMSSRYDLAGQKKKIAKYEDFFA